MTGNHHPNRLVEDESRRMSTTTTLSRRRRHLTTGLDEYHRAIDAGVFGANRVELRHGEVVEMPPMPAPRIGALRALHAMFLARLGWERVPRQTPIVLPSDGEPEPDVAVFVPGAPLKPTVDQVQLVIEVSQATRKRDVGSKLEELPARWVCASCGLST